MNYFDVLTEEHDIFKHEGIEKLGNALLENFGLAALGWTFRISRTKTSLGRCFYEQKVIEFSEYFDHVSWEQIEETIRHEIAHALAGHEAGHGWYWRQMAIRCGAKPVRCADEKSNAKAPYYLLCETCGKKYDRHRKTKKMFHLLCGECRSPLKVYKRKEG